MADEDGSIVPVATPDPIVEPAPVEPTPVDPAPEDPTTVTPDPAVDAPVPSTDAPAADGITFDKEIYDKGDLITATVTMSAQVKTIPATYTPAEQDPITADYQVRDSLGRFEDGGVNDWTYVDGSYTGTTAQFTATAK